MMDKVFDFYTHPLTSKLANVESKGPDRWQASCPCSRNHNNGDKKQSLSILFDRQTNALVLKCHTGCTTAEICEETGCTLSDLFFGKNPAGFIDWFAKQNDMTFVEMYSYCYGSFNDGLKKLRFIDKNGDKTFRWIKDDNTEKSGYKMTHGGCPNRLYVAGNIGTPTVYIVEGEKDANTLHALTGATAVSAEHGASRTSGGKWFKEYTKQLEGKNVYILFDNDEIGRAFAHVEAQHLTGRAAAVYMLDLPSLWPDAPEKGDITDYNNEFGPEKTIATIQELLSTAEPYTLPEGQPLSWDDTITKDYEGQTETPQSPVIIQGISTYDAKQGANKPAAPDPAAPWEPLDNGESLPAFPLERFPAWIRDHINQYTATNGVSKDYCAACVLGTISAVTVGHCDIPFNGHKEPIQLYSLFVGSSGTMKSSVIRHFTKPADDWLRTNNELTRATNYAINKEIEQLEKQLAAEKGKKANINTITDLTSKIEAKRKERHNTFPVPWDDVTPESLVNAMKYSRGTANIATAEGNIINVVAGVSYNQRGSVANIDVFLKGTDGEPIHLFRVTTGETDIPRTDLSMLLAIQPALLERLCRSADAVGRGLAQRFLIYSPPEDPKSTIDHTAPVLLDPAYMDRWTQHITTIAARFMDPDSAAITMDLEPEADMIIRQFWNMTTALIKERGTADEDSIIGWLAKCHGKALRVSALLALLRDKNATTITAEDAENAVALFKEYYIPQFIGAYERADNLTREQRQIVNWIIRHAKDTGEQIQFAERDLWLVVRQRVAFSDKSTGQVRFRTALDDLKSKNYIRPAAQKKQEPGRGRIAKTWQVNPEIFTK